MNKYSKPELKKTVLQRIEDEAVQPHSRLYFQSRECAVWAMWLLSVLVGALAVAVSVFVVHQQQYALYEATHTNAFTYIVEVLPYLWFFVFILMVYAAVYNVRHTKHGYRYSVWFIVVSSLVVSFLFGSALQYLGMGTRIDAILGKNLQMYISQTGYEQQLWQSPEEGRLFGRHYLATVQPTSTVVFADMHGKPWRINVSELTEVDRVLLRSAEPVRLLGKLTNETVPIFHACAVFSWSGSQSITAAQLRSEREKFQSRIENHARKITTHRELQRTGAPLASTTLPVRSVCATMPLVRQTAVGMD